MNNAQTDEVDGSATYVISLEDPGIHNWLDPVGCSEILMISRLQLLAPGAEPTARAELMKLHELDRHLPSDIRRCGRQEREQQLNERHRTFALRHAET